MPAHDMWDQRKHDLVFPVLSVGLPKQIFQDRNLRQTRYSAQRLGLLIFQNAAQQVHLAFLQANLVLDLALPDDRLVDAPNIPGTGHGRNIQRHFQGDFSARVYVRGDVDVHAHIQVLKLSITEKIYPHATHAGLERARRDRHAIADLQRRLLPIQGAYLRILQQFRIGVAEQIGGCKRAYRNCEISRIQITDPVQVYGVARAARRVAGRGSVASAVRRGGVDVVLQGHRGAGRRINPVLPYLIPAHLHDGNFHNHFRLGLIQIINQFLCQSHLVRCSSHHDGILRGQLLNAAYFQDGTHRVDHILQLGGLREVRQVKSFNDALFQLFTLAWIVGRNKDRIARHRTPEGLRLHGDNFQRFLQGDAIQFNFDPPRSVVRVEQHIDPRQLPHRLVDDLAVFGELEG